MTRKTLVIVGALAVAWLTILGADAIVANYEYENMVLSYWNLADKASTIPQKSEYLDRFVVALGSAQLPDHAAIWLKTPDNDVSQNMLALKSLQGRLHEIQGMDVQSFQYQQAIQQITAQEQGEASNMLAVFENAWYLSHHFFLYDWIGGVLFVGLGITAVGAFMGAAAVD